MAFGQLGLGAYFWEMETREFLNAWIGHIEGKRQDYAVLFETVKFGSYYNVFSNEQAKALKKAKNPYIERVKPRKINALAIGNMLSAMAKAFKGNG